MSDHSQKRPGAPPPAEPLDLREHGATIDGNEQAINARLFVQMQVFTTPEGKSPGKMLDALVDGLSTHKCGGVVYRDVNDPRGFGVVTFSEDASDFVTKVRPALSEGILSELRHRPEMSMLGRTYSSGYERDLPFWILERPIKTLTNPDWPWGIWYPLRRHGNFELLEGREKGGILREHATIGRAYGEQDLAHDVRLACHGMDTHDNDFVIGLVGHSLHPLSHVVQTMRKTQQTAKYIQQMGPFFVGHAAWSSTGK